jgi:DNA-directed RNA polymerase alpha subunit
MKCENCKYWLRAWSEADKRKKSKICGYCHRYPQAIEKYNKDWCGEFKENQNIPNMDEINWSIRVQNIFYRNKIESIDKLLSYTARGLLGLSHLGESSLWEIRKNLEKYNLFLRNDREYVKKFFNEDKTK